MRERLARSRRAGRATAGTVPGKPPVPREHIFRAAMQVALVRGFGHVTLDAVARAAGISKGGLLYHFATKRDLIAAILEHYGKAGPPAAGARGTDPLAVAALIAAAEDPSLLAAIAARLGLSGRLEGPGRSPGSGPVRLAGALAARLQLDQPFEDPERASDSRPHTGPADCERQERQRP